MEWLNYESEFYSLERKKVVKHKFDNFLVDGFQNNQKVKQQVDSFAFLMKPIHAVDYADYQMWFYKKSSVTNREHLTKNPKDLYRHSQGRDLIFLYKWHDGVFLSRFQFEDGVIIDPDNKIVVEDIKE